MIGGVFNSPEAQLYWQERVGDLGAVGLVQAQVSIRHIFHTRNVINYGLGRVRKRKERERFNFPW